MYRTAWHRSIISQGPRCEKVASYSFQNFMKKLTANVTNRWHYNDSLGCWWLVLFHATFCIAFNFQYFIPSLWGDLCTWVDNVYTVPDPLGHRHDIKFNSFKTSVALKSMVILQNLMTTNHRKSGRSKNNLKLTEIIVVTTWIRYRVNGVSLSLRSDVELFMRRAQC